MRNRETTRNVRNDCYRNVTFWNHEKMFGQTATDQNKSFFVPGNNLFIAMLTSRAKW